MIFGGLLGHCVHALPSSPPRHQHHRTPPGTTSTCLVMTATGSARPCHYSPQCRHLQVLGTLRAKGLGDPLVLGRSDCILSGSDLRILHAFCVVPYAGSHEGAIGLTRGVMRSSRPTILSRNLQPARQPSAHCGRPTRGGLRATHHFRPYPLAFAMLPWYLNRTSRMYCA